MVIDIFLNNVVLGAESKMAETAAWTMAGLSCGVILDTIVGKTMVPCRTCHFHHFNIPVSQICKNPLSLN